MTDFHTCILKMRDYVLIETKLPKYFAKLVCMWNEGILGYFCVRKFAIKTILQYCNHVHVFLHITMTELEYL